MTDFHKLDSGSPLYLTLLEEQLARTFPCTVINYYRTDSIFKVQTPLLYPDLDLVDVFVDTRYMADEAKTWHTSDLGETLRLYDIYDVESSKSDRLIEEVCTNCLVSFENGRLFCNHTQDELFGSILKVAQASAMLALLLRG